MDMLGPEKLADFAGSYMPEGGANDVEYRRRVKALLLKAAIRMREDKWFEENFPGRSPAEKLYLQNSPLFLALVVIHKAGHLIEGFPIRGETLIWLKQRMHEWHLERMRTNLGDEVAC